MFALLGKVALLSAVFFLPAAVLGWVAAGLPGLLVAASAVYGFLLYAGFTAETKIRAAFRAGTGSEAGVAQGLGRSLDQVVDRLIARRRVEYPAFVKEDLFVPTIAVFPDPFPNALVIRGLSGPGTLLLSQGLLLNLSEAELRAVMTAGLLRNQEKDWSFKTYCMLLGIWLLRLVPQGWSHLAFSVSEAAAAADPKGKAGFSPLGALRFAIAFPLIRALWGLASSEALTREAVEGAGESWVTFSAATRKMSGATRMGAWSWALPASASLCEIVPYHVADSAEN